MWLKSPDITCVHGFSTREGGVSPAPFYSLNLGGSQDNPSNIAANREIALKQLGLDPKKLSTLKQVHGTTVRRAISGAQEGDALVTDDPEIILTVSIADCYPILFSDAVKGVIAAAHAGWRGTLGKIAGNVVKEMLTYGSREENIQIAIGQGISRDNFEVGAEVIEQFEKAGFPDVTRMRRETKQFLDLVACNKWVLTQHGVPEKNIWSMDRCTFEPDFFSYRRDHGATGRMWGLITLG